MRKPVASAVLTLVAYGGQQLFVICDDGSVWAAVWNATGSITEWEAHLPIPKTEASGANE